MEINGLKFERRFNENGVSSGFDVNKRFTWSEEGGKDFGFSDYGKEVRLQGLTLDDLVILSDSIKEFVKAQRKGYKDDVNLRSDLATYIRDNAYNSLDLAFKKGFNSVLTTCQIGLKMTNMSVNEIIDKIKEFKQQFTDYDGQNIIDYDPIFGTVNEVDRDVIKLEGYNKALHALLRIIETHKKEAADKDAVGNWKPTKKVIKLGKGRKM